MNVMLDERAGGRCRVMPRAFAAMGLLLLTMLAALPAAVHAAPRFQGLRHAMPAPGAALLIWDRAQGQGDIKYRVYGSHHTTGFLSEVQGTHFVILDLTPGQEYQFMVRAIDSTGEDTNSVVRSVVPVADSPAEEWRAAWIQRFEWTRGTTDQLRGNITRMMDNLGRGNFNAVVFQVRGQGDTLYPSAIEPWSDLIDPTARNFDYAAHAAAEARRNGLEFHAWINLSVIWQNSRNEFPRDQNHPLYRWAHPTDASRQLGVVHNRRRRPEFFGSSSYTWLTPGNPELEAYLRSVVMEVVQRYQPDGLHWDDRTGLPGGPSHDPVSLQRHQGRGNPMNIADLRTWQMDQIYRMLANIYVQANAHKPSIVVTFSPFGIYDKTKIPGYARFSDALTNFGTDPLGWMNQGALDAVIPQLYWPEGDPQPSYGELVENWLQLNTTGRPIWPGSTLNLNGRLQPLVPNQLQYIATARALGANGNTIYHYGQATDAEWAGLSQTAYRTRAAVPRLPHKAALGNLGLVVRNSAGAPVVDAHVRVAGQQYIYLSSGDGFVGIPGLQPGRVSITIEGEGGTRHALEGVIEAGRTAWAEVTLR